MDRNPPAWLLLVAIVGIIISINDDARRVVSALFIVLWTVAEPLASIVVKTIESVIRLVT